MIFRQQIIFVPFDIKVTLGIILLQLIFNKQSNLDNPSFQMALNVSFYFVICVILFTC